jgi:hypothetical protein
MTRIILIAALLTPTVALAGGMNCVTGIAGRTICSGTDDNGAYQSFESQRYGASTYFTEQRGNHTISGNCITGPGGGSACSTREY